MLWFGAIDYFDAIYLAMLAAIIIMVFTSNIKLRRIMRIVAMCLPIVIFADNAYRVFAYNHGYWRVIHILSFVFPLLWPLALSLLVFGVQTSGITPVQKNE